MTDFNIFDEIESITHPFLEQRFADDVMVPVVEIRWKDGDHSLARPIGPHDWAVHFNHSPRRQECWSHGIELLGVNPWLLAEPLADGLTGLFKSTVATDPDVCLLERVKAAAHRAALRREGQLEFLNF